MRCTSGQLLTAWRLWTTRDAIANIARSRQLCANEPRRRGIPPRFRRRLGIVDVKLYHPLPEWTGRNVASARRKAGQTNLQHPSRSQACRVIARIGAKDVDGAGGRRTEAHEKLYESRHDQLPPALNSEPWRLGQPLPCGACR